MTDKVFGIDLGTTYSAIAHINDFGQPEVIRNLSGQETTPSVVQLESESSYVVGRHAKNQILLNSETTVSLIKRHMGTDYRIEAHGRTFTPEAVSAIILKDLVESAQELTRSESNKVVITVPAYFGVAEKEATRQAGEVAGLEVVGIVAEPVAAALSVGIVGDAVRTVFVYDLGGGTFDCTVMQMGPGLLDVVVVDGNRLLGGADWDTRLFDLLNEKFIAQAGLDEDPTADEDFAQLLMNEVEQAKIELTARQRTSVTLRYGDALEKVEVTREEFEEATRTLLDQTIEIARRALAEAEERRPGLVVDEVLLVGGSSRMPMVEAALAGEGWTLRRTDHDLAVAKGAAVYGQGAGDLDPAAAGATPDVTERGIPMGDSTVRIRNVLSRGIGVLFVRSDAGAPDGWQPYVDFTGHANDPIPLDTSFEGRTIGDGVTSLEFHIFEQSGVHEDESPELNKEITPEGGAVLRDLPRLPAGSPIHFELHIDGEGLATLSAFEPASGQRLQLDVSLSVLQAEDVAAAREVVSAMTRAD